MNFKTPDHNDLKYFKQLCGDRVFAGELIKEDYTHDEMKIYGTYMPDVVIEAETTEEVAAVLKYCNDYNIAVTPRGAGTGLCGGCTALYGGVLLSLIRMNRVLEIDRKNMTATVQAGLLLMDFIDLLTAEKLFYPPDPGEKSATLGGNVMTNAGGMRAVRYGVTRDYVKAMTAVLPGGEIIHTGGKLSKNSSGYCIRNILIGSEGTLAVVTEVILKILPRPEYGMTVLVPFGSIKKAVSVVADILSAGLNPTAVEFMQLEVLGLVREYLGKSFPDSNAPSYLLISIDAEDEETGWKRISKLSALLMDLGAEDVFYADTDERKESLWTPRGAFLEAIKSSSLEMDECDVVVPVGKVEEFVEFLSDLAELTPLRINYFGHAGDGNLHIYICYDGGDRAQWQNQCDEIMKKLYEKALEVGGQVSGEHGIGHAKVPYLKDFIEIPEFELMKKIKLSFDPKGILNPGKVIGNIEK